MRGGGQGEVHIHDGDAGFGEEEGEGKDEKKRYAEMEIAQDPIVHPALEKNKTPIRYALRCTVDLADKE